MAITQKMLGWLQRTCMRTAQNPFFFLFPLAFEKAGCGLLNRRAKDKQQ